MKFKTYEGGKVTIQSTGEEVDLLWYGFSKCVIEHSDGRQKFLTTDAVGIPKRPRWNSYKREFYYDKY